MRIILGPVGVKYFIKIIFDIIWAINNWLYTNKLLYFDKLLLPLPKKNRQSYLIKYQS